MVIWMYTLRPRLKRLVVTLVCREVVELLVDENSICCSIQNSEARWKHLGEATEEGMLIKRYLFLDLTQGAQIKNMVLTAIVLVTFTISTGFPF